MERINLTVKDIESLSFNVIKTAAISDGNDDSLGCYVRGVIDLENEIHKIIENNIKCDIEENEQF